MENMTAKSNPALSQKVTRALLIANEISEESSRQYSLASLISLSLEEHSIERGSCEILEARLAENGNMSCLIELLESINQEVSA